MSESNSLLKLRDISKVFFRGTLDEVRALDRVNLDVNPQDYIAIIGSNGAGKTTSLNIIAGVFPPENGGRVVIDGRDVTALSEHKRACYVGRVY